MADLDVQLDRSDTTRLVRVGAVQMAAVPGAPEENLRQAEHYVRELAVLDVDLVVLPEMFVSGYELNPALLEACDTAERPYTKRLVGWAAEYDIVIVAALLTSTPRGGVADTAMVIDRSGVLAEAAKAFLWGAEAELFERGTHPPAIAKTDLGCIGVAICYEAGFPEVARDLAVRGADIIAIPAAFGRQRLHAWDLLTRSRALENGCFVVAAGLTGPGERSDFAAHSRVVSPAGDVIAGIDDSPGVVIASIDLRDVERSRRAIPYLDDLAGRRLLEPASPESMTVTVEGAPS